MFDGVVVTLLFRSGRDAAVLLYRPRAFQQEPRSRSAIDRSPSSRSIFNQSARLLCSGSINKKKEKKKKKGLSYEELRLPAITAFTSGGTQTRAARDPPESARVSKNIDCVSASHRSSVRLGRDRGLSPWPRAGDHVELPEVHHGSPPAAASASSQRRRCYCNAVCQPSFLGSAPSPEVV